MITEAASVYPRNFGNYVLLERIGAGGMSEIDLARRVVEDSTFMRFLVIKRIKAERSEDEAFVRMFKDEARISAELHHTNIAQVYDFGKIDDEFYLVLEYVPGVDVRRILNVTRDRGETVPLRITLRIICDLLSGLHFAHTRVDTFGKPMNVVHRDVNPRNIMVSLRGDVKLIDFGVAKATDRLERTQTDHVKGKFAYMAPEQVSAKEIDGRVDVFAAALTFHEMIAGVGPFYGLNQVQIMHRLMAGQVPDLPAHHDLADMTALRRVHRKALAQKPEDRYPTAEAYRKDLERVAERIGGLATQAELAAYLQVIEPEFDQRLRDRVAMFSGPIETLPTTMELPGVQLGGHEGSGSMSKASQATYTNITARQAGVAAMGGMAAVAMAGGVLLVLLLAVAGAAVAWKYEYIGSATAQPVDEGEASLRALGPTSQPTPPDPTVPVDAALPPTPEPTVHPAPGIAAPVKPVAPVGTASTDAAPLPTPSETSGTAADTTTPGTAAVQPVTVEVAAPLALPPDAAAFVSPGTIQVASAEKGRAIFVNGKATGFVTPAKVPWPPGTIEVRVEGYAPKTTLIRSKQIEMVTFQ